MESGDPPAPGRRTNAICLPSGDHLGEPSRSKDGAIHLIGVVESVYTPTKP
jgi:hypothetical protein